MKDSHAARSQADVIVLMGVAGSGKSTVGVVLAKRLGWDFVDGDDLHPKDNIEKMSQGIALSDEDRDPWLSKLAAVIRASVREDRPVIVACSALKKSYRDRLRDAGEDILFVFLDGAYDVIEPRIRQRPDHFAKSTLLQSQLETLERPTKAIMIGVDQDLDAVIDEILAVLSKA